MIEHSVCVARGELLVPAHALQEYLFVSQAQEIAQTAIVGDVPGYTSQTVILERLHHVHSIDDGSLLIGKGR